MKQFELGFGKGSMTIALPEKNILAEVEGNEYPAIENIEAEVKNVLRNPIGSAPLKDLVKAGEKVGIVVSDVTRGWIRYDRFLHFILDELNEAGVPDSDITLIVGLGSHRLHTEEEHKSVYGISADRVAISQTMSNVEDAFEYLGTTSHGTEAKVNKVALAQDKLILTGGIVYHLLAGFGGGRKSIVPAITAYDTIQQNHRLTLTKEVGGGANPACGSGLTEGNPMNEDLIEIAKMVNPDFIFNITLTAEGQFAGFFAGDWMQAWEAGCKRVEEVFGVPVPAKADIVLASGGGYPKDINCYQGSKTFDNANMAGKDGGVVISVMEFPDIAEPPDFSKWFDIATIEEHEMKLREAYTIPGFIAFKVRCFAKERTNIVVTRPENRAFIEKTGMRMAETLDEAMAMARDIIGHDDYTVTVMSHAANTMPIIK